MLAYAVLASLQSSKVKIKSKPFNRRLRLSSPSISLPRMSLLCCSKRSGTASTVTNSNILLVRFNIYERVNDVRKMSPNPTWNECREWENQLNVTNASTGNAELWSIGQFTVWNLNAISGRTKSKQLVIFLPTNSGRMTSNELPMLRTTMSDLNRFVRAQTKQQSMRLDKSIQYNLQPCSHVVGISISNHQIK